MTKRIDPATAGAGAYKMMAQLEAYTRGAGIERPLLELVKLRASYINGCAYCVDMHGRDMRAAGEPPERLDGLAAWDESPYFTAREKAALAWAESLTHVATTRAPDDVYAAMRAHFSELDATHLTFAVALMNALNRIAVGMRRGPVKKD